MSKVSEFISGIREMDLEDLKARVADEETRLKKLEFAHAITPLENPMSIRLLRRDLARMKNELSKRNLENK